MVLKLLPDHREAILDPAESQNPLQNKHNIYQSKCLQFCLSLFRAFAILKWAPSEMKSL